MALILCVECGKEFSDKAKACPNCGCPIEYIIEVIENQKAQQEFADHSDDVVAPVQDADDSTNNAAPQSPPYAKENLLSYSEMRNFAFSSILPYINKELNGTITDIKRGTGEKGDVHYYIFCGRRVIGIKVVLDAYPDVYNVGRLFNDDASASILAKAMHEQGYEFAVANIGIGASDHMRFSRRIFLRNDGYYFNYKELRFVKYNPQAKQTPDTPGIRYSLSENPAYYAWKKIAGFKYEPPQNTRRTAGGYAVYGSDIRLQKPKDTSLLRAISAFWNDEDNVIAKVKQMCLDAFVDEAQADEISHLVCYASSTACNKIRPEDLVNYVCNAIDFITGIFLSDSVPVDNDRILIELREMIRRADFEDKYEVESNEVALINYLLYLFITDRSTYNEYLKSDFFAEYKGKRLSSIGYIYHATKDAFIADPKKFGYGQDVVDEIARLQNINSPQNLQKYAAMRATVESEMRQYCVLHEKVVTKKALQLLGKAEESQLRQFSTNVYELLKFAENNFDVKLAGTHKRSMDSFHAIVTAYQRCLGMDEVIISRQLRGKYGLFERMDDAKESKARFERFVAQYRK